jgi:hypothetical protein
MKKVGWINLRHFSSFTPEGKPFDEYTESSKVTIVNLSESENEMVDDIIRKFGKHLMAEDCYHNGSCKSIERITFYTSLIKFISGEMRMICRKIYDICSSASHAISVDEKVYSIYGEKYRKENQDLIEKFNPVIINRSDFNEDSVDLIIYSTIYGD